MAKSSIGTKYYNNDEKIGPEKNQHISYISLLFNSQVNLHIKNRI